MGPLERTLREHLAHPSVQVAILVILSVAWLCRDLNWLLTGDAVRYASISRTMAEGGSWLEPVQWGAEPYFRKPPLGFWLGALSMKAFGVSSAAAMLPSIAAAVGVVVLLYVVMAKIADPLAALAAALLLLSTPEYLRASATFRLESLVLLCMVLALIALEYARERPAWFIGFWALLGVGVMTKSGAGLIPLPVILLAALLLRDAFPFQRPAFWAAAPAFFAVAGPWYTYMHLRHADAFWAIHIGEQAIERFGAPRWVWADVWSYLRFLGPMLALVPVGAVLALRDRAGRPHRSRHVVMAVSWTLLVFGGLQALKPNMEESRYMYYTLAATAGLSGYGLAALVRARARAEHAAAAAAAVALLLLLLNLAGADLRWARYAPARELVPATTVLLPRDGPLAVISNKRDGPLNFAHFYFGRHPRWIEPSHLDREVARVDREAIFLADATGLDAARRLRPEILVDGHKFYVLRFPRAAVQGTAAERSATEPSVH